MAIFDNELMTVEETCELLRVSRQTVYRLRRDGHLPFATLGRSVRIARTDAMNMCRVYANHRRR